MILGSRLFVRSSIIICCVSAMSAADSGDYRIDDLEIAESSTVHTKNQSIAFANSIWQIRKQIEALTKEAIRYSKETKTLYLTFDDGPIRGTQNVINTIKDANITATMFLVGKHIQKRKDLYLKVKDTPSLLIANHTYSHANGRYARFYRKPASTVIADINKTEEITHSSKRLRLAGRNTWRLPHVNRNDGAIKSRQSAKEIPKYDALHDAGYKIYGWDIEWRYSKSGNPLISAKQLANKIESQYKRGKTALPKKTILLMHDFMFRKKRNVIKLQLLIKILKDKGWKFDTVDHYDNKLLPIESPQNNFNTDGTFLVKLTPVTLIQLNF